MNQKFSLSDFLEREYRMKREDLSPKDWSLAGLYMPEIESMLDLAHLYYTNKEQYEIEIKSRHNRKSRV